MLLDHVASMLGSGWPAYYAVRTFGRITAPVMAYFIAEGYHYTRNVKRYMLRLALFAVISAVPFRLFESGTALPFRVMDGLASGPNSCALYFDNLDKTLVYYRGSVITTLFLGLLAIVIWDRLEMDELFKLILTVLILRLADFSDWSCWLVLYCLAFHFARENKALKWSLFSVVTLLYVFNIRFSGFALTMNPGFQIMRLGTFLVIPLLEFGYSEKAGERTGFDKWFFYLFYPAHLLVLYFVRLALNA